MYIEYVIKKNMIQIRYNIKHSPIKRTIEIDTTIQLCFILNL